MKVDFKKNEIPTFVSNWWKTGKNLKRAPVYGDE